jgi:HD-like signal output (HDOD) protein
MTNARHNIGIEPRDLVTGIVDLATAPEVYARVTELLDDPSSSLVKLSHAVEQDPGLTARLLKIVNSAFYGFPSRISTVSKAITIIGQRELRDLVLATTVLELFNGLPNELVSMGSFWHQSLRCGVVARVLASRRQGTEEVQSVFVAGLLHEVGHLIIYRKIPELAREAILRNRYNNVALHLAERQVFGFDYAEVGGELMRLWKLPMVLQEAVELHQTPHLASSFRTETAIVHLARRVAVVGTFEMGGVLTAAPASEPAWKIAGLSASVLEQVLPLAQEQYEAAVSVFC